MEQRFVVFVNSLLYFPCFVQNLLTLIRLGFLKVVSFRKNVPYDDIKSHIKISLTLSLDDIFFKKPQGGKEGVKLTPPNRFRVNVRQKRLSILLCYKSINISFIKIKQMTVVLILILTIFLEKVLICIMGMGINLENFSGKCVPLSVNKILLMYILQVLLQSQSLLIWLFQFL